MCFQSITFSSIGRMKWSAENWLVKLFCYAPFAANASAVNFPIPLLAPVIIFCSIYNN